MIIIQWLMRLLDGNIYAEELAMNKITTMKWVSVSALLAFSSVVVAEMSAGDIARLGKDLTPVGAEVAGNADGSIPAWTGGLKSAADAGHAAWWS